MSSNSGELWTLLIGPIFGLPIALLPIQILWINLITDGMPAVYLSYEKSEENVMHRPPKPPKQSIFAKRRGFHLIWVGVLMAAIALTAQSIAIRYNLHWQTIIFNVLCFRQLGHLLAIRSQKRMIFSTEFLTNKPLIFSVLITIVLQLAVTFTPILQPVFHTQGFVLNVPIEVLTIRSQFMEKRRFPDNKLMREFMKRHFPTVTYTIENGNATEGIIGHFKRFDKNALIVLGAYRRSDLSRWFKISMADILIRELESLLFIAHNK